MRASFWNLSLSLLSCSHGVLAGPAAAVYGYDPAEPAINCKTDPVCGDLRSHKNPAIEFCRSYIKVPEIEVRITKIALGKTVTKIVEVKSTKTVTVKKAATTTATTTNKSTKTKTATAKSTETDTTTLKTTETDYLTLKSTETGTTTDVSTESSTILDISTETVTETQISTFTLVPQPTLTERREIGIMQRGQLGYRNVVIPPYLKKHAPARITLGCSCLSITPKKHTKTVYSTAKPTTKTITKTNCKTITTTQRTTKTAKATKNIVDIVYTTIFTIATAIETEFTTDTTFITFTSLTTLIITDSLTITALTTVPTTTTATTTMLTTTTTIDPCAAPYPTSGISGLGAYSPMIPDMISAVDAHDCCKQCYEDPALTGCMEWAFTSGMCIVVYGAVGDGVSDACPNGKAKVLIVSGPGGVAAPGPCNGGYL